MKRKFPYCECDVYPTESHGFWNKNVGGAWFCLWGIDWMVVVLCEWQVAPPSCR